MERDKFILLCQKASFKQHFSRAWWQTKWNDDELVSWNGSKYVPIDYRFGFQKGTPRHLAIVHDLKADCEYTILLSEIEECQ